MATCEKPCGLIGTRHVCVDCEHGKSHNNTTKMEIKTMALNLNGNAVKANESSNVYPLLKTVETLIVERFATTQKHVYDLQSQSAAINAELSAIKGQIKALSLGIENLTAAIQLAAKANNVPATKQSESKPIEKAPVVSGNNELKIRINNGDIAELRTIVRENQNLFAGVAVARNLKMIDDIAEYTAKLKANMLSKLGATATETKTPENVAPIDKWTKQLFLNRQKLSDLLTQCRRENYEDKDYERKYVSEFLGHNNLPGDFYLWLKSVAQSVNR